MIKLLILLLLSIPSVSYSMSIDKILLKIEKESGCKLRITSGKRTKLHNKRVGGAPKSYHLTNKARDFRSAVRKRGCGLRRLARISCKYATTIRYKWHLHIDNRPKKKCWKSKYKKRN